MFKEMGLLSLSLYLLVYKKDPNKKKKTVPVDKPPEKAARTEQPPESAEEIKPRTREWEKHKAPWMEELKLNQAKKTSFIADGKSRLSGPELGASKAASGSTDRYVFTLAYLVTF